MADPKPSAHQVSFRQLGFVLLLQDLFPDLTADVAAKVGPQIALIHPPLFVDLSARCRASGPGPCRKLERRPKGRVLLLLFAYRPHSQLTGSSFVLACGKGLSDVVAILLEHKADANQANQVLSCTPWLTPCDHRQASKSALA